MTKSISDKIKLSIKNLTAIGNSIGKKLSLDFSMLKLKGRQTVSAQTLGPELQLAELRRRGSPLGWGARVRP